MMKSMILLIFLCFSAEALELTHHQGERHQEYFKFVMKDFIPWIQNEINLDLKKLGKEKYEFIQKNINDMNHWHTPEYPLINQTSFGFSAEKNKNLQYFSVYIHKKYRDDKILIKLKKYGDVLFFEWDSKIGACFIFKSTKLDFSKFHLTLQPNSSYFTHHCDDGNSFITVQNKKMNELVKRKSETLYYHEFLTYNIKGELIKTTIKDPPLFPNLLPQDVNPFIKKYQNKTMLSIDKYSINQSKEIMIYVP
jgi:hypothetical protein